MLLSERPNKTYIVVVERYNSKLGIDETSSYTIEAPTLAEAVHLQRAGSSRRAYAR